ncbi:Binding partner of ACD11 1 [Porphyridium purpureum]|uniref:Binding partner of ACD11 1 n=1 Tax=Porphyridium purpureum TaxID=35688 RepID=A0A5J4YK00_PORPP|nr:Binding partner of ACD11 1 [Porphyridium purpureum]|eukprot:POR7736..scf210_14
MEGYDADALDTDTGPFPPPGQAARAVRATNLSPMCTKHDVDAFFSFCGKISAIRLRKARAPAQVDEEGHPLLEAIVLFENDAAQQTAVLLNGSAILDRDVCIETAPENWNADGADAAPPTQGPTGGMSEKPADATSANQTPDTRAAAPSGTQSDVAAARGDDAAAASQAAAGGASADLGFMNSWGSTVSSWLTSAKQIAAEEMDAYKRGEYEQLFKEGLQYAQTKGSEFGRNIEASAQAGTEQIAQGMERIELDKKLKESVAKMNEMAVNIDRRLHISDASNAIARSSAERVHELDENYHLRQRIQSAADGALSNEAIASLIRDVNERSRQMWMAATEKIDALRQGGGSATTGPASMLDGGATDAHESRPAQDAASAISTDQGQDQTSQ